MTKGEALQALQEMKAPFCVCKEQARRNAALNIAIDALQERKTGKWLLVEMGDTNLYECSLCRNRKTRTPPFCDICGAKMEIDNAMDN